MGIIPNKMIIQAPLKNYTSLGQRKVLIEAGVSYGDDLRKVKAIALQAIRDSTGIDERDIEIFFTGFGDSSINFHLRFWIDTVRQIDYNIARSDAIIALKEAFDAQGVTIPFPIRTLDFSTVGGRTFDELEINQASLDSDYRPEEVDGEEEAPLPPATKERNTRDRNRN